MTADLRSNRGDWVVSLDLRGASEYASEAGADVSVRVIGAHWDGDRRHDVSVSIDHLWVRLEDALALAEHVHNWARQPLEQLAGSELSGEFELGRLPGQSLCFRFGPRADTIAGLHPVVTILYSAGVLSGEAHFATDPSCLTSFGDDLRRELRVLA